MVFTGKGPFGLIEVEGHRFRYKTSNIEFLFEDICSDHCIVPESGYEQPKPLSIHVENPSVYAVRRAFFQTDKIGISLHYSKWLEPTILSGNGIEDAQTLFRDRYMEELGVKLFYPYSGCMEQLCEQESLALFRMATWDNDDQETYVIRFKLKNAHVNKERHSKIISDAHKDVVIGVPLELHDVNQLESGRFRPNYGTTNIFKLDLGMDEMKKVETTFCDILNGVINSNTEFIRPEGSSITLPSGQVFPVKIDKIEFDVWLYNLQDCCKGLRPFIENFFSGFQKPI